MRARLQRQNSRLTVTLVANRRQGRKIVTDYFGVLASCGESASASERARFLAKVGRRLKSIAAHDPRLTVEEVIRIKASVKARLPPPMKAEVRGAVFQEEVAARPARPAARQSKRKGEPRVSA